MTNQHPITPPPELVLQWSLESQDEHQPTVAYSMVGLLAAKAARWGADQELEACVEWFDNQSLVYHRDLEHTLRTARRPKPPSLKAQALLVIDTAVNDYRMSSDAASIIRRALEALDD